MLKAKRAKKSGCQVLFNDKLRCQPKEILRKYEEKIITSMHDSYPCVSIMKAQKTR